MSGLTALVDTLLATRLAQRVDLVPLKSALEIAGPEAAAPVEKVSNDVRLPSRAALQQQLGVGLLKADQRGHGHAPVRQGEAVTLSAAARAVNAILEPRTGGAGGTGGTGGINSSTASAKVMGAAPLLPSLPKSQAAVPQLLSAALARTVAHSGLFYESHLAQFVAGTRTLGELAKEPQARLAAAPNALPPAAPEAKVSVEAGAKVDAAVQSSGMGGSRADASRPVEAQTPAQSQSQSPAQSPVPLALTRAGDENAALLPSSQRPLQAAGQPLAAAVPSDAGDAASNARGATGTAATPGPSHVAPGYEHASLHGQALATLQDAESQAPAARPHAAFSPDGARSAASELAGIHPEAVALVRQQLELLAVPVFRWGGEAWPGTPMQWEVREEHDEAGASAEGEAPPRTWSTRLALTLPTLKDVEVRISLSGSTLQVHLAAREQATLALLGEQRHELPERLGDLGLQLQGVQLGALPAAPAGQDAAKDADGR